MMALELALQMYDELDALYEASFRDPIFAMSQKAARMFGAQCFPLMIDPPSLTAAPLLVSPNVATHPWLSTFGGNQPGDDVANVLETTRKVGAPATRPRCHRPRLG